MLLTARNIEVAYRDRRVLHGLSFELAAGEIVALVGPNGSGKSTLIRTLLGQLPTAGQIQWEQQPLSKWAPRMLARRVAYLAQSPVWEAGQRVAEVLRLGRTPYLGAFGIESDRDVRIVLDVASQLGLTDLLDRPMDTLSGGQRQRVFVGRCLVQEPVALLLDEPNTYLDLRHQVELGAILKGLARERGIAVLMASHDLNLAASTSDRIVLLHEGKIAAVGTPDEVMRPEILNPVYGVKLIRVDRSAGAPLIVPESA